METREKESVAEKRRLSSILDYDLKLMQKVIRTIRKSKKRWVDFPEKEIFQTDAVISDALIEISHKAPIYSRWLYDTLPKPKAKEHEKKLAYA